MISVCFYYIKSRIKHTIDFRVLKNLTGSSVVKNLPAITGDPGSVSGLGRSPGEGNGNPLQYSCLRESHGQRSLEGSMGSESDTD